MARIVLLGPQRLQPTLRDAVTSAGVRGPLAVVTAGWEEREDEVENMEAHLGAPVVNLQLHARAERVFLEDWELAAAYARRRARLVELGALYRARLAHFLDATRELDATTGTPDVLEAERADALRAVRELDDRQAERLEEVHREFDAEWRPLERRAVARQRIEVARLLRACPAIALAGGNVAILANRLRLFGIAELVDDRAVFAWSAGAMAAGERVVLFHDSPPRGPGYAEVFGHGLGLHRGVLPLPHARRRLRLDDPGRVARFARRFAPLRCIALDEGTGFQWDGAGWSPAAGGARVLTAGGTVEEIRAA